MCKICEKTFRFTSNKKYKSKQKWEMCNNGKYADILKLLLSARGVTWEKHPYTLLSDINFSPHKW